MKLEYLTKMDRIIKAVGTQNPDEVLASMGMVYTDPGNSLQGFIARRKGTIYYGVNKKLSTKKYVFGSFHEAFHVICTHLDQPGFLCAGGHMDSFTDLKMIAATEREANIGAADVLIDSSAFLDMTGYDSADVQAYMASVESFEQAVEDYRRHFDIVVSGGSSESRIRRMQSYKDDLGRMHQELHSQANDISHSGYCLTKSQIAKEFQVPEYIIDYKYEAMAVRNYNVPSVELPLFEKVFGDW